MRIGIPKEIKEGEYRVAMVPEGVEELTKAGHQVYVEKDAGMGSGFENSDYEKVGAVIAADVSSVWASDLVVKVKEPLSQEFDFLRPNLGLFTYLHLASAPELAAKLVAQKVRAIAYETVRTEQGVLPLLKPMSQIAGRVAMLFAAHLLQKNCMGKFAGQGLLLGGIEGITKARVVIIGGGNVGRHAAQVALGLDADVTVLDPSEACLKSLNDLFQGAVKLEPYSHERLQTLLLDCDVLIGAALIVGEHAPQLLSRKMIASMPKASLFVDVAIDQGGMSQTSRPTSYHQPTYIEEGVVHCCLPNLPSAVAKSSTQALTHVTFPYVRAIAKHGLEQALLEDSALAQGVNTWDGKLKHEGVKKALSKRLTL